MAKKKASTHASRPRTDSDAEAAIELAASASTESDTAADLLSFDTKTVSKNLTEPPSAGEFSPDRDSAIAGLLQHKVELESQIRRLLQNQQDLKASETRYFDLFDLAPVGYLTLNHRCVILEANLAAAQMLRVERSQLAGLPLIRFLFAEDRSQCFEMYQQITATGLPQTAEIRLRRNDESTFWARIDVACSGHAGFLLVITDITERKQSEHAQIFLSQLVVRDNDEEYLRAVTRYLAEKLDATVVCINRIQPDTALTTTESFWLNGEIQRNIEYELSGTPCGELRACRKLVVQDQLIEQFPTDLILRQIGLRSYYGTALYNTSGQLIGMIAALWNEQLPDQPFVASLMDLVSMRVAARLEKIIADEKLRRSTELLQRVGEITRIGGWELDVKNHRLTWSEVTFQLHEFESRSEPSLEDAINFFASECRDTIRNAVEQGLQHGTPWDLELICITAKGRRIWVNVIGEAEVVEGRVIRLFGTFRDITRTRQEAELQRDLEIQLRHSQKMEAVGQLAGGIAHDFNNILTVINGTADIAAMRLPPEHPLLEDLLTIRQAGNRAATLTRQLVAFSRRQDDAPQIVDTGRLIDEMRAMLRRLIRENIRLVIHAPTGEAHVMLDPGQLEQVIMNLCVNARDAMPVGGQLTIRTQIVAIPGDHVTCLAHMKPGRYVQLTVADTGVGMNESVRSRIFEPFFTTKTVGQGSGLGLSTVYGIVTRNGGHISVISSPGEGAVFTILLPQILDVPRTEPVKSEITMVGGSETVLVVEDEAALLELVRQVLQLAGYHVIAAGGAREALNALDSLPGPLHLLLTDVVMPDVDGPGLAKLVAERHPETRVLFTSGYTEDLSVIREVSGNPAWFIPKPYRLPELTRKVREVLDLQSPQTS